MKPKIILIAFCAAFITLGFLPEMLKPYLVHPTGNIKIIGSASIFIVIVILFRWNIGVWLFYASMVLASVAETMLFFSSGRYLFLMLVVFDLLLTFFFIRSKTIKRYLANEFSIIGKEPVRNQEEEL